jgi:hypothetical protein
MLRGVRLLPVAFLSVVLGACGGGPSDTEQVHAVVQSFGRATAAKDYQKLCDSILAPKLVDEVESAGLPCEVALKQGLGEVEAPTLTIGAISVDGDKASAEVNSSARGQAPSHDTLQLVRVGGDWRIASLGR